MEIKNIIFLVTGVVAGIGGTYLVMKDNCEKIINEEGEKLKKYYDEKLEEAQNALKTPVEAEISPSEEVKPEKPKAKTKSKAKPKKTLVEPDYEEVVDKLNYNKVSTEGKKKKPERPYPISYEEYCEFSNYKKETLSYFTEDETLMYVESEEVIDDLDRHAGLDNLDKLGEEYENDNEIYIRNEEFGVDYHIIAEFGTYKDFIYEEK